MKKRSTKKWNIIKINNTDHSSLLAEPFMEQDQDMTKFQEEVIEMSKTQNKIDTTYYKSTKKISKRKKKTIAIYSQNIEPVSPLIEKVLDFSQDITKIQKATTQNDTNNSLVDAKVKIQPLYINYEVVKVFKSKKNKIQYTIKQNHGNQICVSTQQASKSRDLFQSVINYYLKKAEQIKKLIL